MSNKEYIKGQLIGYLEDLITLIKEDNLNEFVEEHIDSVYHNAMCDSFYYIKDFIFNYPNEQAAMGVHFLSLGDAIRHLNNLNNGEKDIWDE